jgi:hypothetical protein
MFLIRQVHSMGYCVSEAPREFDKLVKGDDFFQRPCKYI